MQQRARRVGIFHILFSLSHFHFAEGMSLLCHQTIAQPCHYYAVKVVSGCGVGVSNGSEVAICGT